MVSPLMRKWLMAKVAQQEYQPFDDWYRQNFGGDTEPQAAYGNPTSPIGQNDTAVTADQDVNYDYNTAGRGSAFIPVVERDFGAAFSGTKSFRDLMQSVAHRGALAKRGGEAGAGGNTGGIAVVAQGTKEGAVNMIKTSYKL